MRIGRRGSRIGDGLAAAVPAAVFGGIPSTIYAIATRQDPLEASVAAGSILLPHEDSRARLLAAALPVHLTLSALWGLALGTVLPRKRPLLEGITAGVTIAILDLGIIGRRNPRIRALEPLPQIADHVAFGVVAAMSLAPRGENTS
jgi:hypothetical protein